MKNGRIFLDTNVLVHWVYDGQDPVKNATAIRCLEALTAIRAAWISPQVIGEFLRVCTRHLRHEVTREIARGAAQVLVVTCELAPLDEITTREALRVSERYRLDYYDAQIWAAARVSGCEVILTEDTHGSEIEGVRYRNPFEAGFDVESLLRR